MKILPITPFTQINIQNKRQQNNNKNVQNPIEQNNSARQIFAYQDFNISFRGRTPEDFYAQDFNRNNMPTSMKEYLDYDYETRQHIPPEQMMAEVFKYLKKANNFSDVKSIYPNEELFQNLHSNKIKGKTSLLAEISMVKDMEDAPLLKDGSDDFGMYLLKKIYLEGKTLKEINKDFHEKDINDTYKDIITKPLTNNDTAAYGIRFPKQAFWHSFIATRDEYKKFFVTLPKNSTNPAAHLPSQNEHRTTTQTSNTKSTEHPKRATRKYKIPDYQKKQLTNDIKSTDMSKTEVEKKVRKRFGKDDPQASFIVRYLSPIMTVAADKVHLSEEMRDFNSNNPQNNDNKTLFKRFWKANPYLLEQYAKSITDSMEMFEETYESGGNIPINTDLEEVTPNSKNNKIIDFVNQDFLDLLDYTQGIEPNRTKKYQEHDEMQKQWEEYFKDRYGEIEQNPIEQKQEVPEVEEKIDVSKLSDEEQEDLLYKVAKENNGDVFKLHGKSGQNIYITGNLDEGLAEYLKERTKYLPTQFARQYSNDVMNNPDIDDKFKLSIATRGFRDKLDDDRVMSDEEFEDTEITLPSLYSMKHLNSERAATAAIIDVLCENFDDIPVTINKLRSYEFYDLLENSKGSNGATEMSDTLLEHKKDIDARYSKYNKPLTSAEINKLSIVITDKLSKYDKDKSKADPDSKAIFLMLKESIANSKSTKKLFKNYLSGYLQKNSASWSIMNDKLDDEHLQVRLDNTLIGFLDEILLKHANTGSFIKIPIFKTIIDKNIYNKYRYMLSPEIKAILDEGIENESGFGINFDDLK